MKITSYFVYMLYNTLVINEIYFNFIDIWLVTNYIDLLCNNPQVGS